MWTGRTLLRALLPLSLPLAFAAAQEPTASLRGTVTDSIRHAPLVGATVVASRTGAGSATGEFHDYTATSDARGHYSIDAIAAGTYVLTVEHPWLDSTGLSVPAKPVDLTRQRAATLDLAVPSGGTIRAAFCPIAGRDSSIGLVAGYVTDSRTNRPVAGARVVFVWSDFDVDPRTARATPLERALAAVTGRDGTFRMCGLPVERSILMQAQFGDHGTTGAVQVEVPTSGVLVESLQLNVGDVGTTSITGHVRREGSQSAIAGARVHVFGDTGEVVTAADGSFKLDRVSIGTQSVEVTALGFYPRRYALDVRPTSTSNVTITLLELATVLDSVNIVAQRSGAEMPHPEFDQRSAHGHGVYITEGMIAKAAPLETANLFQQINGLNVLNGAITSSRGITSILVSGQNSDRICQPTLYVDGTPVSMGNVNDISPSAIYGIEVYVSSATAPAKYHAGLCGLILIWTR